ncbi:MAG: hypothetical protein AVDCRST_MAG51-1159 [uncultured Ramlibacter sp.]|uniref:Uncharacterized protein n=1 Tax=uncultured Ramlibacter sp. TaxID=260755 RepID=A0A6J4P4N6_9BURK|nr:MAG: hypothetical protein AVDCRST_MAG51-1159 [uncultured Ramlibacter sp.]
MNMTQLRLERPLAAAFGAIDPGSLAVLWNSISFLGLAASMLLALGC